MTGFVHKPVLTDEQQEAEVLDGMRDSGESMVDRKLVRAAITRLPSVGAAADIDPMVEREVRLRAKKEFTPAHWGGLLMDLLMDPDRADEICLNYGTTYEHIAHLLKTNSSFAAAMRDLKQTVRALGANAGHTLRARGLAEALLPVLGGIAMDKATPPALRVKTIELIGRYGHLDPTGARSASGSNSKKEASGPAGVVLNIQLGPALAPLLDAKVIDNGEG